MRKILNRIKNAEKKGLFRTKKLFSYGNRISESELSEIENGIGSKIPADIKLALLELGEGFINDLSFHGKQGIYPFDNECGCVEGFVTFASDDMGNYYAYSPQSDDQSKIYYICHDPEGYCVIANDIVEFLSDFVARDYNITKFAAELELNDIHF